MKNDRLFATSGRFNLKLGNSAYSVVAGGEKLLCGKRLVIVTCAAEYLKHKNTRVAVVVKLAHHSVVIEGPVKGKPMPIGVKGFVVHGATHVVMYVGRHKLVSENVEPLNGIGVTVSVTAIVAEANVRILIVSVLYI